MVTLSKPLRVISTVLGCMIIELASGRHLA